MANKKIITILAGAVVSFPILGTSQSGALPRVKQFSAAATGGQIAHTVQRGENLWRIARDHGFTEQELMDYNRLPNSVIRPGQVIRMPAKSLPHPGADAVSVAPRAAEVARATTAAGTYTVKGGDILSRIAKAHGVTTKALMEANGISDAAKLRIGQTLQIPGGGGGSPVKAASVQKPVGSTTHTVRKGDTLFGIASLHKVSISQIKASNNLASEQLRIGQSLVIPGSGAATAGEVVPTSASQPKVADYGSYTVQKGDTFSKIARQFGTTSGELIRVNQIADPNVLIPGQNLMVPGGTKVVSTPAAQSPSSATANVLAGGSTATAPSGSTPSSVSLPAEVAPPALPDPSPVRSGGVQDYAGYTIVPGDTLDTIAQTFATTKAELMRLNKLSSPDEVKSGDQILVPTYGIYNDLGGPY